MNAVTLPELPAAAYTSLGAEVFRGLTTRPRTLSPWLFYDQEGSQLFEQITGLDEYYLTRTERGIFRANAGEIIAAASTPTPSVSSSTAASASSPRTSTMSVSTLPAPEKTCHWPRPLQS